MRPRFRAEWNGFPTALGAPPFIKSSGEWRLNPAIADLLDLIEDFDARLNTEANKLALSSESAQTVKLRIGAPPIVLGPLLGRTDGAFSRGSTPNTGLNCIIGSGPRGWETLT